jgi:hypothetical protein
VDLRNNSRHTTQTTCLALRDGLHDRLLNCNEVLLLTTGMIRQLVVGEYKCNAHVTRTGIDLLSMIVRRCA